MNSFFLKIILTTGILFSCKKEINEKYCWRGYDRLGNDITGVIECGKTLLEMQAVYPEFLFYKADEPKYCWQLQALQKDTFYVRFKPESLMDNFFPGYSYTKVGCNSFCIWTSLDKTRSKVTGLYSATRINKKLYNADSCSKLFVGRIITIRETVDTIVTREFTEQVQ